MKLESSTPTNFSNILADGDCYLFTVSNSGLRFGHGWPAVVEPLFPPVTVN